MSAHPAIEVGGEFPMLHKLAAHVGATIPPEEVAAVSRRLRSGDVYGCFNGSDPVPCELEKIGGRVTMASLYAKMATTRCVSWCGNKTPQNTENLEALLQLFPGCRFIFICRDVRDVCLSWQRKWGKDMILCASKWNGRMMKGLDAMARLPAGQVLKLRYEEFTADPESAGRAICAFLELPFSENLLEYERHIDRVVDGKRNFGQSIKADNQGRWRQELRPEDVRRIEEIAMPTMKRLGYMPELGERHRPLTRTERLAGVASDTYASLAIGNRYRTRNGLRDRLHALSVSLRYRMPSTLRRKPAGGAGRSD
jgi:hypothetical protein